MGRDNSVKILVTEDTGFNPRARMGRDLLLWLLLIK